jgi:hypothetical protein
VTTTRGETPLVDSLAKLPEEGRIEQIEEPYILGSIHAQTTSAACLLRARRSAAPECATASTASSSTSCR